MRLAGSAPSLRHLSSPAPETTPWRDMPHVVVEICTEDVEGVRLSARAGADRAELCDNLGAEGTTPSIGTVESAIFAASEEVAQRRALAGPHWAKQPDAAPTSEHVIDRGLLRLLIDTADGAPVTFNKAIDATRDLVEAYGDLGGLGVDYVLTSGGSPTALEGAEVLRGLVSTPGGPRVIAAGHVRPANTAEVIERTGVREIHMRCSRDDCAPGAPQRTDEAKVRRAVEAARSLGRPAGADSGSGADSGTGA